MVRSSVGLIRTEQSSSIDMTCNKKLHCLLSQRHLCSCDVCIHRLAMNKSAIHRNANCATIWKMLQDGATCEDNEKCHNGNDPMAAPQHERSEGQLYLPISVYTQEYIHHRKFHLMRLISLGYDTQSSAFEIAGTLLKIYTDFVGIVGNLSVHVSPQRTNKWSSWSKALFQGVIFFEPVLHQAIPEIIFQLKKGSRDGPKAKEFTQLLQQFVHLCDEMLQPIQNKSLQALIDECWSDQSTEQERSSPFCHMLPLHMDITPTELIAPPSAYNIVSPMPGVSLPVLSTSAIPTQDCTNLFAEMPFGSFSFAPQDHHSFSYSLSRPTLLKPNPLASMKDVATMIHPPSISDESSIVSSDEEVQVTSTSDGISTENFGDILSSSTKIFNPLEHKSFPAKFSLSSDQNIIFQGDSRYEHGIVDSNKKTEAMFHQLDISSGHIGPTYPPRFGFSNPQIAPFMRSPEFSIPSMPLFPSVSENPPCFASVPKTLVSPEFGSANSGMLNLLEKAAAHPAFLAATNQPKFPSFRNFNPNPAVTASSNVQNRKKLVAHSKLRQVAQEKQSVKPDVHKLQSNILPHNPSKSDNGTGSVLSLLPHDQHEIFIHPSVASDNGTLDTKTSKQEDHAVVSDAPNMPTAGISDETFNETCQKDADSSSCARGNECKIANSGGSPGGATKYCDCCYCEFFGNGGPTVAPTSKNYNEMRERLRMKLKQRKDFSQNGKSECHPAIPSKQGTKHGIHEDRPLEEILSFIEGADDRTNPSITKKSQKKNKQKDEEKKRAERQDSTPPVKNENPVVNEKNNNINNAKPVTNKRKKKKKHNEDRNESPTAPSNNLPNNAVKKENISDNTNSKPSAKPVTQTSKQKSSVQHSVNGNYREPVTASKPLQNERKANNEEPANRKSDSRRKNATRQEQQTQKNSAPPRHSPSFDQVFLPKDGQDSLEMDDVEKEIDSFKRFCLDSQTKVREKKIKVNWKDFSFKKVHIPH